MNSDDFEQRWRRFARQWLAIWMFSFLVSAEGANIGSADIGLYLTKGYRWFITWIASVIPKDQPFQHLSNCLSNELPRDIYLLNVGNKVTLSFIQHSET